MDDAPLSLPPGARRLLLAPATVTKSVAVADPDPERRWMLRLPRAARRSFVHEVLDRGGSRALQERWLILADDEVRRSYLDEVLAARPDGDPREAWMLRQSREVRESYVREVLDRPPR